MKKHDELASSTSCLNKASDDEPLFVLRAQDRLAAETVLFWAKLAIDADVSPDKVVNALKTQQAMKAWSPRKLPD